MNNLRQLGVALQNYQAVHTKLPPAAYWDASATDDIEFVHKTFSTATVTHANWVQLLLPHLGEIDLAAAFDAKLPLGHPRNEQARTTDTALLKCPSDGFNSMENHYQMQSSFGMISFARGNYAINGGSHRSAIMPGTSADPVPDGAHYEFDRDSGKIRYWGNGIAGFNKSFSTDDFANGLSTTVAVDEIRAGIHPVDSRGAWALGQIGASVTWWHGMTGDDGRPNENWKRADDIAGCGELQRIFGEEKLIEEGMPCCSYCTFNDQATARSEHPGGVNVLMMDGSVYFVSNDVDPGLWHVIHSRETPAEILEDRFKERLAGSDQRDQSAISQYHRQSVDSVGREPETIVNSIGMKLKRIEPGRFIMGLADEEVNAIFEEEGPARPHWVEITDRFYIGMFEVTQDEYERVIGELPSWHSPSEHGTSQRGVADTSRFPVEQVTWNQAVEFCRRLSDLPQEKQAGRIYRLPTEAEWEYACRAGKTTPYIYIPERQPSDISGDNAMKIPPLPITTVGSYPPNQFGLYDMRGNVWEWCADWYQHDYYQHSSVDDPPGPAFGYLRVVRGCDWIYVGQRCTLGFRATAPWRKNRFIGFRVLCELAR
jgi:prepilin-type processing-associated H-X9-DG protein